ncbi:MAG TPA: hypothetical protein VKZ54_10880 [Membranihabitans sp.]|nr:hypothetical protein [Membranihabitans sp.]
MKVSRNDWMAILGFIFFLLGSMSLILSLIGIHFTFLRFLENWGGLFSFLAKLLILITGIVLIYISKTQYPRKGD